MKTSLLLICVLVAMWLMAALAYAEGESCSNPIVIPAVTYYENTASTCGAANLIPFIGSCGGGNPSGPDLIYRFTLGSAATVTVRDSFNENSWDFDQQFMIFTDCANPTGSCIASVDNWPYAGFQEEIHNMHLAAGTYYVALSMRGTTACGDAVLVVESDVLLPVELRSFDGTAGDNSVILTWTTAAETNNDHFDIERDGQTIANVPSQGSATGSSYAWTDGSVHNGTVYHYSLVAVSVSGERRVLGEVNVVPNYDAAAVTEYALRQNYPNPFNPSTSIAIDLVDNGFASLKVYNLMGQEVATLVNCNLTSGRHIINFNAANLPSGVYLYRLNVNGFSAEKKMLLMK